MVAVRFLEKGGYRVIEAESGEEALERATEPDIALILMDIEMYGMDGLEATRRLRRTEATAKIPIVGLTAHAVEGYRELCLQSGMDDYLSKPVSRDRLLRCVARNLGRPATELDPPQADPGARTALPPAPGSEPSTEPIVVDLQTDIGDLLPAFIERCRESSHELLNLDAEDHLRARRIGHNLKGAGSAYGLPEISRLGAELEEAALREQSFSQLAAELDSYLARIRFC